ncbi:hypothetical protein ANCCAN_25850 [Ancylostoma caninum]|uniref:Uncharacterized protein n=1 Tax=Ancylostoma caninum TaxID=29170 RepID=A0A368F8F5_ANCCA|nr:hypothetical protein ANCCAN_25850 [Ancylostoma caninum]
MIVLLCVNVADIFARLPSDSSESSAEDLDYPAVQKKSLELEVPEAEHVCPTTIMKRHKPKFGHMGNGSFVELQQDSEHSFEATFVECTNGHHRPPCHGIDTIIYSSECVTSYEWRTAFVRLPGSNADFIQAQIKVSPPSRGVLAKTLREDQISPEK